VGATVVLFPSLPSYAVDRPELWRRLDDALERPLTVVVAPPGSGKTVLLAQWVGSHPERTFVWLSIDSGDNDAVRFARRMIRALAAVRPEVTELLSYVYLSGDQLGSPFIEALVEHLGEWRVDLTVVIDDLHRLSNNTLVGELSRLAEALPPTTHLVVSTRVDLPIAWNRPRMRDAVLEFRQSDLAFDDASSSELLSRIAHRPVDDEKVAVLVQRTEGWVAGLQLAAMTLRGRQDDGAFIAEFSGNDRLVADYLSGEVLEALPDALRAVLLRVSVVDALCADLVGQLTGLEQPQLFLEQLEHQSMFLVPLDAKREWFRFHQLFQDLLRYRLRSEHPGAEAELLRDAADWYVGRGQIRLAVECLLRAQDWEGALQHILTRGSEVFERGESATVLRWIHEVPESFRAHRNDVQLLLGVLQLGDGQAPAAEDTARRVLANPQATPGEQVCAQTILAALVQWRHHPRTSVASAEQSLRVLADLGGHPVPVVLGLTDNASLETVSLISGGRAHFLSGNFEQSRNWLDRGLASSGAAYSVWRVNALGSLGLVEAWCGNLDRADGLVTEALSLAHATGRLAHPSIADAYLARTLILLERGEPNWAATALHDGTLGAAKNRRTQLMWVARLLHAQLIAAHGDTETAMAALHSGASELGSAPPPVVADRVSALRLRTLRLGGSVARVAETPSKDHSMAAAAFEHAAAALTAGDVALGRKLADEYAALGDSDEPLDVIQRLILSAWSAKLASETRRAQHDIGEAVRIAESDFLVDVFVRSGPQVVGLVAQLVDEGSGLKAAVLRRSREARSPARGQEFPEPLTGRELELLTYLPSRMSNADLATLCFVSVNTIKTHIARIYRKLGVTNRNEAVERARELGLI